MTTSWTEIQLIEKYLSGKMSARERTDFDHRLAGDSMLRMNVKLQRYVYTLIGLYGRERMRMRIERAHERLFSDPARQAFADRIRQMFIKH